MILFLWPKFRKSKLTLKINHKVNDCYNKMKQIEYVYQRSDIGRSIISNIWIFNNYISSACPDDNDNVANVERVFLQFLHFFRFNRHSHKFFFLNIEIMFNLCKYLLFKFKKRFYFLSLSGSRNFLHYSIFCWLW